MQNFLSQIDLSKLFRDSYIFEKLPSSDGWYLYLTALFGFLILIALVSFFVSYQNRKSYRIYRKTQKKIFYLYLPTGITGLFLIFCRFEQIPYLASRWLLALLALIFIVLSVRILIYIIFTLPKEKQKYFHKQKFNQYLPRKKADLSNLGNERK